MKTRQSGRLKFIIILIIGIVLGSHFFGFSVKDAVENEQTQENFSYIKEGSTGFYNTHIKEKAEYFWNNIVIELFWKSFLDNMMRIRTGEQTDLELSAPEGTDISTPTIVVPGTEESITDEN